MLRLSSSASCAVLRMFSRTFRSISSIASYVEVGWFCSSWNTASAEFSVFCEAAAILCSSVPVIVVPFRLAEL